MSNHLDYEINKELGECYLFMGDMDKAEEYYRKAAGSNGVHPDPYLGLATIFVQRGELDNALTMYRKAASIEATDKSLAGMALVEMELGNTADAHEHFAEALTQNPENVIAVFGLIQTAYVLERLAEVVPHLENYLALDPLKDEVRFSLAGCLASLDRHDEAAAHLERILERDPANQAAQELYGQIAA
jgi:tetratricopeptide (TPR) repeat protein